MKQNLTFEETYNEVKKYMTAPDGTVHKRFYHSESVMNKALEINKNLKLKVEKDLIKYSAILHDSSKLIDPNLLLNLIIRGDEVIDNYYGNVEREHLEELIQTPYILHALAAPYVLEKVYSMYDIRIIDAVKYHCTGRSNMSTLEELIFVADYIEDLRVGEHFDRVRYVLNNYGLKAACCEELKQVISYLKQKESPVYYLTQEAYDYYKKYDVDNIK